MILNAAFLASFAAPFRFPLLAKEGQGWFIAALQTQRVARLQRATQVFCIYLCASFCYNTLLFFKNNHFHNIFEYYLP